MGWVANATPRPLYSRERPCTYFIGCWVGPRAGLDGSENLAPTWIQSPDCPARSEPLYRLRYPGPRRLRVLSLFGPYLRQHFRPFCMAAGKFSARRYSILPWVGVHALWNYYLTLPYLLTTWIGVVLETLMNFIIVINCSSKKRT
jgi:hypothetical protein